MPDSDRFEQRLRDGQLLLLDGAIGTELERQGVPMHDDLWCAQALETHPQTVVDVHRSYIEAGADVITTNSYASPPHALIHAGVEENIVPWNQRAVALAVEARDKYAGSREVYIAGSVSTYGTWRNLDPAVVVPGLVEQSNILIDSGVDFILLETLAAQPELVLAAVEAVGGLDIPVWVAISCLRDRESGALFHGDEESQRHSRSTKRFVPFDEIVRRIAALDGSALLMMHSDFDCAEDAVGTMRNNFDGPVGVYPNAGYWQKPNWTFVDQIDPRDYAQATERWISAGAQIVGGCCGIGPAHIAALDARLERR